MSRDEFFEWLNTCPDQNWYLLEDKPESMVVDFNITDEEESYDDRNDKS